MPSTGTVKTSKPVTDGKNVYVFGGSSKWNQQGTKDTFALNLTDGTWAQKASMNYARFSHFAVQINDEEFLIGGDITDLYFLFTEAKQMVEKDNVWLLFKEKQEQNLLKTCG